MTKTYTMPQMPLKAAVYYNLPSLPPLQPPDEVLDISLSPITPADYNQAGNQWGPEPVTHIIRCQVNGQIGDNSGPSLPRELFPCTVFEYPQDSQHWYCTIWYHECGAGFANWHGRVYVTRYNPLALPDQPAFISWT